LIETNQSEQSRANGLGDLLRLRSDRKLVARSYGGLGHTLPAGWGNDTWTFFNGFQ
jgi:hypothetical protein